MAITEKNYRKRKSSRFTHRKKLSSKYIGVGYSAVKKKYFATVRFKGNPFTKYYRSELSAAKGYDELKLLYYPKSKCLNFPPKEDEEITSDKEIEPKKKRKKRDLSQAVARRAIKKHELWYVLQSQNYCCNLCNELITGCVPIIDHIIPLSCGGTYVMNNLQALCSKCNSWKSGDYDYRIRADLTEEDLSSYDVYNKMKSVYDKKHSKHEKRVVFNITNNDSSTCNFNFK